MVRRRGQGTHSAERYARVDTALRVIRELLEQPWSVRELAKHMRLSHRSLYRLMHAIERGGLPLQRSTDGRHVRYRVRPSDVRRALGLGRPSKTRDGGVPSSRKKAARVKETKRGEGRHGGGDAATSL